MDSIQLNCTRRELFQTVGAIAAAVHRSPQSEAVIRVQNGGELFTDNQAGVTGVDCGYSLPIGGHTLWFFGDVFLASPDAPIKRWLGNVSNCALIVPSGSGVSPLKHYSFVTDPRTKLARQVIPLHAGEGDSTRLWPAGGWYNSSRRQAFLYYSKNEITGFGPFGFKTIGHGLALAETTDPKNLLFSRLISGANHDIWWREDSGPLFGCAVVSGTPGSYLYIAGVEERGGKKVGKMARVRKSQITNLMAYEYFTNSAGSPGWSPRLSDAVDVAGLSDFPNELSIAYNSHLGGYLAVHSVLISERIRLSLAKNPWGPYKPLCEISALHRALENAFCYAGKEHHELAEQNGKILYITYVDSERYWLQLLKVTLS